MSEVGSLIQEAPEIEAIKEAMQKDIQEAAQEDIQEITEEGCTEERGGGSCIHRTGNKAYRLSEG